jgi:hypothetical protein
MPAYTEFGRRILVDPMGAKAEFLTAFNKVKGRRTPRTKPGPSILKELGCSSFSIFYRWVELLGIDLEELDKMGEGLGWPSRRSGGGGFHENKALRVKRAKRTMKKTGVRPGRKPSAESARR